MTGLEHLPGPGLPTWLRHRPRYYLLACLSGRAQSPAQRLWRLLIAVTVLWIAALALTWSGGLTQAADHPFVVFAGSLIVWGVVSLRRRLRLLQSEVSWISSLPSADSLTERVLAVPLAASGVLAAIVALAGMIEGPGSLRALIALSCGSGAGMLLALLPPRRTLEGLRPQAQALRLTSLPESIRPSLMPLAHWPLMRQQVWGRPKVLAFGSFVLLMGLPMTTSTSGFARMALGSVAAWFIGHHLLTLLLSLIRTAFAAMHWMFATPLGMWRFTFFLSHRVWLKEGVVSLLLVAAVSVLEPAISAWKTLQWALAWTGLCVLLGITACALARRVKARGASLPAGIGR